MDNQAQGNQSEIEMILPFLRPEQQQRWLDLFRNPKGRRKLLDTLWDGRDLNLALFTRLPPQHSSATELAELLRAYGSPEICHVRSARPGLDGKDLPLKSALELVVGLAPGTFISCVPGEIAYYEGDEKNGRYLVTRGRVASPSTQSRRSRQ